MVWGLGRKVDTRLPGKRNSNYFDATTVHRINSMIMWIRTSRLSLKHSLSFQGVTERNPAVSGVGCRFLSREFDGLGSKGLGFGVWAAGDGYRPKRVARLLARALPLASAHEGGKPFGLRHVYVVLSTPNFREDRRLPRKGNSNSHRARPVY